ncbi:MAG: hypothetical protein JWN86_144 [Planctomycetota bacterium]|nr:hypothetical protein [Planctomycetota bacterium]
MPDWLSTSLSSNIEVAPWILAWRIGAALVMGGLVAMLYRWSRRGEASPATFPTTLVLLAGLIAMVTQVIGDNVARAFSLVGALSVVRFRTVVKDTQDTAFVILAVVVGMASGASHLAVALVGLGLLTTAAPLLWPPGRSARGGWDRDDASLRLKVEQNDVTRAAVDSVFRAALGRHRLLSASTAKNGVALDLTHSVRLRADASPEDLIGRLNGIAGVSGWSCHVKVERPRQARTPSRKSISSPSPGRDGTLSSSRSAVRLDRSSRTGPRGMNAVHHDRRVPVGVDAAPHRCGRGCDQRDLLPRAG